jgi:predicted TPR repeat methyltransferase
MPTDSHPELVTPDEAVRVALSWQHEGRLAEAAMLYQRILEVEPSHPEALHFLGLLKHQLGSPDEGLVYLRRAVEVAPDYAQAHSNLGNMLFERDDYEAAESAYRQASALDPSLTDAIQNLGLLLERRGDAAAAEACFRRAIAQSPDDPLAHTNLGHLLAESGRHEEAEELLSHAIELNPGLPAAHRHLAEVYRSQDRLPEATDAYRRAVELGADGYIGLATALRDQGLVEEAIAAYRKVLEIGGREPTVFHSLGSLLSAQGRKEEAAIIFRQWLEWDPQQPVARHMLSANSSEPMPESLDRAPDDYVEAIFDGFASKFDERLASLDYQAPRLVADALLADLDDLSGPIRILDAGCGTGLCGPYLRDRAATLEGVDLSATMLELAAQRGCYDRLVKAELTAMLEDHPKHYDAIVSADTLVYFGDLKPVMDACRVALRSAGRLVVTVELEPEHTQPERGFKLNGHGRYSHSRSYVEHAIETAGLRLIKMQEVVLRQEMAKPVAGLLVVARAIADETSPSGED